MQISGKKILIIYPHWPPSNLAGVHRARLISNYLSETGWTPVILTVHPDYYEETPDFDMMKTVRSDTEVIYVHAFKTHKIRFIGDIGLRAFFQLKKEALKIIKSRKIDFIWIPIPSFYVALLGRILNNITKIPYGIDYIDPWIRDIKNRKNLRAVLSLFLARFLEPVAVKKASLITGVSEQYYLPVIERNFKNKKIIHAAMPYGFDIRDHEIKQEMLNFPWSEYKNCKPVIYAGAFLPNSGYFIQILFKEISNLKSKNDWPAAIKFFFLGTGNYIHKSINQYAQEYGIEDIVIEKRERFPYLSVLNFLSESFGVLVIGSTEKHYTASKIFQAILSKKPVFAMLHNESSACEILKNCNASEYLAEYIENQKNFNEQISTLLNQFINDQKNWNPDLTKLEPFSAYQSAKVLVNAIEESLKK